MPLTGLKVLDLTRARAGPTAVRQLADWGADVIKIERPAAAGKETLGGDRDGFDFLNLHRNKRSLSLNLKAAEGRDLFLNMATSADVIVENFRPGVKQRLGIDYDAVSAINPAIVYASISGFGQQGPYRDRAGLDQIAQGMSGLMSVTGLPGQGPVRAGIPIADLCAGFNLALAIMLALYERERSGKGQWVHTSLLEALTTMMDFQAARYLIDGEVPAQAGNNHPTNIPTGVFETSDGQINIQAGADHMFEKLCSVLGCENLYQDDRFATSSLRLRNRDVLNTLLSEATRIRSSEDIIEQLADAGVPCGPIYSMDQTFADPQMQTLNMAPEFEHARLGKMRLLGQAINMSRATETIGRATPELGEHSDEILREYGIDDAQVAALRKANVI